MAKATLLYQNQQDFWETSIKLVGSSKTSMPSFSHNKIELGTAKSLLVFSPTCAGEILFDLVW